MITARNLYFGFLDLNFQLRANNEIANLYHKPEKKQTHQFIHFAFGFFWLVVERLSDLKRM